MKTAELLDPLTGYPAAPMQPIDWIEELGIERVPARDVRFLCFEGGGGKGVIFLGAVKELEQRGIITYSGGRLASGRQVEGIAGSSAGALTAVLLSCGYDSSLLQRLLFNEYNFNRFFDLPTSGMPVPTVVGCRDTSGSMALSLLSRALGAMLPTAILSGAANRDSGAGTKIGTRPVAYLMNLLRHWGLFSGCASHRLFNRLIANKAAILQGRPGQYQPYLNLTFAQHLEIFRCKLVLTGSNFSTGKTGFFSAETTPNFPVAAAARISMGLPLIFKPMVIGTRTAQTYAAASSYEYNMSAADMKGVWVDGGYFNNLPQQAFVRQPNGRDGTLGFTLSSFGERPRRITTLGEFILAYANWGLFGGGESQVSASSGIAPNTVPLVAGDRQFEIGLTQFSFNSRERRHVDRLIRNAQDATKRYFDRQ